jgi:cyclase
MHQGATAQIYQRARALRDRSTHAEDVLWGYLKTKPSGYKFRRQHPYAVYILDFYCYKLGLVIEVDGSIHDVEEIKKRDEQRQSLIEKDGLVVLRFRNEDIIQKLEEVIMKIEQYITSRNV